MKKYLLSILLFVAIQGLQAQTFTSGYTFTAGETNITHTKLNSMISGMTVSDIPGTALANTTIPTGKIANNAITSAKVLDQTLITDDMLTRGVAGSVIATNGITEIELSTNITTRAGNWDLTLTRFTANSITNTAVLGTTTGGSASDSGKIVKLNASGVIDSTLLSQPAVLTTNRLTATSGSANTWTAIGSLTTTITNGGVVVTGRAVPPVGGTSVYFVRVRASDHSISSQAEITGAADSNARALSVSLVDSLTTTSTKQYVLEIADGNGAQVWTANAATGVGGTDSVTNHMGMTILQQGR